MQLPKVRFTIRSLLVAVALVALNLAGAVASPRKDWSVRGIALGPGSFYHDWRPDYGLICTYEGNTQSTTGTIVYKLWSVGRGPLPPSLVQAWSPVIASVSITLLVLSLRPKYRGTVSRGAPASDRRSGSHPAAPRMARTAIRGDHHCHDRHDFCLHCLRADRVSLPSGDRGPGPPCLLVGLGRSPAPTVARGAMGVARRRPDRPEPCQCRLTAFLQPLRAHLVQSLASATARFSILFLGDFRPSPPFPPQAIEPPSGTQLALNYKSLFDDIPRVLNLSIDGALVQRCAMEVNLAAMKRLPEVIFQGFPIGEPTIDFRADGNVVGYTGRPGIKLSQPRVLRPPSFSFLEMRWPVIASASLTLLFLVVTVRRLNPRQIRTLVIVVTLSGINLAGAFAYFAREQPRLLSSTWGDAGGSEEITRMAAGTSTSEEYTWDQWGRPGD